MLTILDGIFSQKSGGKIKNGIVKFGNIAITKKHFLLNLCQNLELLCQMNTDMNNL